MMRTAVLTIATALVTVVGVAGTPAWAADAGSAGSSQRATGIPLITGQQWTRSTSREKMAFLIGMATVVNAESRAMQGSSAASQSPSVMIATAMKGSTLQQVEGEVDNYYKSNPKQIDMPVGKVIWTEMVVPKLQTAASGSSVQSHAATPSMPLYGSNPGSSSIGAPYANMRFISPENSNAG